MKRPSASSAVAAVCPAEPTSPKRKAATAEQLEVIEAGATPLSSTRKGHRTNSTNFYRRDSYLGLNFDPLMSTKSGEAAQFSADDYKIKGPIMRFKSPQMEIQFRQYYAGKKAKQLTHVIALMSITYCVFQLGVVVNTELNQFNSIMFWMFRIIGPLFTMVIAFLCYKKQEKLRIYLQPFATVLSFVGFSGMHLKMATADMGSKTAYEGAEKNYEYMLYAMITTIFTCLMCIFFGLQFKSQLLLATYPVVLMNTNMYFVNPLTIHTVVGVNTAATINLLMLLCHLIFLYGGYMNERLLRDVFGAELQIRAEKYEAEILMRNLLPAQTAMRLQSMSKSKTESRMQATLLSRRKMLELADDYKQSTVVFADIKGFTVFSATVSAATLVDVLNTIFSSFDVLTEHCAVEKIKTIGDCYMAISGVPTRVENHAFRAARFALAMRYWMQYFFQLQDLPPNTPKLGIRVGLHSGPVVAGVIGIRKWCFDVWGDTVNVASRMESTGDPGKVHCSDACYQLLEGDFAPNTFVHRGKIEVKGKGLMETHFIEPSPAEIESLLGLIMDVNVVSAQKGGNGGTASKYSSEVFQQRNSSLHVSKSDRKHQRHQSLPMDSKATRDALNESVRRQKTETRMKATMAVAEGLAEGDEEEEEEEEKTMPKMPSHRPLRAGDQASTKRGGDGKGAAAKIKPERAESAAKPPHSLAKLQNAGQAQSPRQLLPGIQAACLKPKYWSPQQEPTRLKNGEGTIKLEPVVGDTSAVRKALPLPISAGSPFKSAVLTRTVAGVKTETVSDIAHL
jgi:class 3 adenylate cyclase